MATIATICTELLSRQTFVVTHGVQVTTFILTLLCTWEVRNRLVERKYLPSSHIAGGSSLRGREEHDYYATPYESTRALFARVSFEGDHFLEPCCGGGHICRVIKETYPNAQITAIDKYDRGYGETGIDFLTYTPNELYDNVITNPPFVLAQEFIEHSLELVRDGGKVAMFLKIQFLEGVKRKSFFDKNPPRYIYVFRARQSPWLSGNPVDEKGKPWSSTMCFAWYIFEKGFIGEPIIRWID